MEKARDIEVGDVFITRYGNLFMVISLGVKDNADEDGDVIIVNSLMHDSGHRLNFSKSGMRHDMVHIDKFYSRTDAISSILSRYVSLMWPKGM